MLSLRFFFILFLATRLTFSQNTDINLLKNINLHRNKNLDSEFSFISNSLGPIAISTPIIIYTTGLIKKDSTLKQHGLYVGESILGATFIAVALKYSVKRDRPYITYPLLENVSTENSPSFPSGHTSLAFSTATSMSIIYPKWYVIAPAFLWASSVAYSRMHLGVHYPSDVLAGVFIGSGSAFLSYKINALIIKHHQRKRRSFSP